jgi:DNA processing protein
VLGGGHRRFFPLRNRSLAEQMIAAGGAVLSPYAPEQCAYPSQFLERNGVVAALADAVVVVEAPVRSGALNTAGWAAGRIPVLAVPGDVDRAHAAGCHALIRDGATLARDARDVLEELGIRQPDSVKPRRSSETQAADPLQRALLRCLCEGERTLDELVAGTGERAHRVLAAISVLDLAGAVEIRPGQRYSLR